MKGSTYLVTGGNGYIGTVLIEELVRFGSHVIVVDNGLVSPPRAKSTDITSITADIRDPSCLSGLMRGVDGVVHLAAIVGDRACDVDGDLSWETNYIGTINVTEACKQGGVRRLVFVSTCSNYGVSVGQTADVTSPLWPQSVYAESKVRAEHHVLVSRNERFKPCILRLATIYGVSPRMRFDLVVNRMTACAVTQREILVNGGEQWRPFVHVRDVAAAVTRALTVGFEARAEVYNCGSDEDNYRMLDVARLIAAEVGDTRVIIDSRQSDRRNYRVGFGSIATGLGFRCERRLREGIRELRDAIVTGQYGDFAAAEYDNYLMTERYVRSGAGTQLVGERCEANLSDRFESVSVNGLVGSVQG